MNNLEIDRLIAEKIMGWNIREVSDGVKWIQAEGYELYFSDDIYREWMPSEDMSDAWLVVEKLRERKIFTIYDAWDEKDEKIFCANFQYNDTYHVVDYSAYADTAPMAICLAALKVVGVEVQS